MAKAGNKQIGYIQTLAIKSYEVSELINLFTTLNKRQKKLKESYTSSNINNIKHTAKRIKRTKTQIKIENANSNGITAKSMRKMEMISNKYENVINMCLNENKGKSISTRSAKTSTIESSTTTMTTIKNFFSFLGHCLSSLTRIRNTESASKTLYI